MNSLFDGLHRQLLVRMKVLFKKQLELVLRKYNENKVATKGQPWALSPVAWHSVWGSILLVASISRHFCLAFGVEKVMILDIQYAKAQSEWLEASSAYKYAPS